MKNMLRIAVVSGIAAVLAALAGAGTGEARQAPKCSAPVAIAFEKHYDETASAANGTRTWTGRTVDGGTVEVRLLDYRSAGALEELTLRFAVTVRGRSFVARLRGTFDDKTKRTALSGTVTSGWLKGARVQEEGLQLDAATSRFVGLLRLASVSGRR